MAKCLKLCTLLLGAALMFGCAAQQNGRATAELQEGGQVQQVGEASSNEDMVVAHNSTAGKKLVKKAKSAMGTPYVRGGTTPGGFDCSGFVKWTYNSIGVDLPRTAREQSTVGKTIRKVEDMREGDIVAFNHPKRGYHTGIYVGDGKFIHSPRQRSSVRINSLSDPYYSTTFLGARRVNVESGDILVAQAKSELDQYAGQPDKVMASNDQANMTAGKIKSRQDGLTKKTRNNTKNLKINRTGTKTGSVKRLTKSIAENTATTKAISKKSNVVSMLQHKKTSSRSGNRS